MSTESGNLDEIIKRQLEKEAADANAEAAKAAEIVNESKGKQEEKQPEEVAEETIVANEEEGKEPKAPVVPKKSFKEILAEQEAEEQAKIEEAEIRKLKDDPDFKAIKAARKNHPDKTLQEIVNMLADVNPKDIDDKSVFINSRKSENLTPEELEEEWEEFKGQKPFIQERYLESERSKLNALRESKQKEYGLDVKPVNYVEQFTKAKVSLEATLEKVVGKEIDGVTITSERAGQLYKESQKFFGSFSNSNGEVDVNEAFETAFAKLYRTIWKKEGEDKARSEGKVEAFNELHNPNAEKMVSGTKTTKAVKYDKDVDQLIDGLKNQQSNSFLTPAN